MVLDSAALAKLLINTYDTNLAEKKAKGPDDSGEPECKRSKTAEEDIEHHDAQIGAAEEASVPCVGVELVEPSSDVI